MFKMWKAKIKDAKARIKVVTGAKTIARAETILKAGSKIKL